MKKSLLLISIIICAFFANAQTTGSFQESVSFTEADYNFTRTLYYHVPADYDASQSYKLVVGFRGGPHSNAGEFRDQLEFLSDSIGAIVVCPENIDHFWNQEELTKQLFQYTVEEVSSNYNIDPDYIYLTGLSFGGRHAVIVSMDTDAGPIPNIRGVIPFAAGSESHLRPDYENIEEFPPACICIGLNDSQTFIDVSNTLNNDILENDGSAVLNEVPGVGHTTNFSTYPNEMMECFSFIESQYSEVSIASQSFTKPVEVLVFPNPATEQIEFSFGQSNLLKSIELFDHAGKLLKLVDPKKKSIDISSFSEGMVSLVFTFEKTVVVKKLIISD